VLRKNVVLVRVRRRPKKRTAGPTAHAQALLAQSADDAKRGTRRPEFVVVGSRVPTLASRPRLFASGRADELFESAHSRVREGARMNRSVLRLASDPA